MRGGRTFRGAAEALENVHIGGGVSIFVHVGARAPARGSARLPLDPHARSVARPRLLGRALLGPGAPLRAALRVADELEVELDRAAMGLEFASHALDERVR